MNDLVKSRQRVADHGKVFTPSGMVEAMLDLVKDETQRIDSRFLAPACGTLLCRVGRGAMAPFTRQHFLRKFRLCSPDRSALAATASYNMSAQWTAYVGRWPWR